MFPVTSPFIIQRLKVASKIQVNYDFLLEKFER